MTRTYPPAAGLLCLCLLLAGCGSSPPNNFYVLSAQPFPAASGQTPALGIGPIRIPEYLSRKNMVYQLEDNALQVSSSDLWAEPLGDGIQRVLALNLSGLLGTQDISFFPWHPERAPDFGIEINLLQLDATQSEAMLRAEWTVYVPGRTASMDRRISRLQTPLPGGVARPEAVAAAYSALLFEISQKIAATIAERTASSESAPDAD